MQDQSGRLGQAADAALASRRPQPGTGVAARGERWARLRRSLWQPPRPHGEQPRERVVSPLELFYDLAVVVLVAQAAHHLAGHLTWAGLGEFAAVFTLVWIAWANGSLHLDILPRLKAGIPAATPMGAAAEVRGSRAGIPRRLPAQSRRAPPRC